MAKVEVTLYWPLFVLSTLVLLALKLTAVIDWSWWIIFSPLLLMVLLFIFGVLYAMFLMHMVRLVMKRIINRM